MFDLNNFPKMVTYECRPYLKIVVLKIDTFASEIIDERNFSPEDKALISDFKRPYLRRDDCQIVEIEM